MYDDFGPRVVSRFGNKKGFWKLRRLRRRISLALFGRLFEAKYSASQIAQSTVSTRPFLRDTALPAIIGCALVASLIALDGPANDLADWLGLGAVDEETYGSFLEAVAGVTGVFLALYFTAVTAVAASVYASVPHDIRVLITRDRLGNVYVRVVAFTTALSILLLVASAGASFESRLAIPVVGSLSLFSIFAFIRLGQRAFYLADPTRLASSVILDFKTWFDRSRAGGWHWNDPPFQGKYRSSARGSITTLASLIQVSSSKSHLQGESVRQLFRGTVSLVAYYLSNGHTVPTESKWFGQKYEHSQWYLADSTSLELATMAAGALQPKTVPDNAWVEDALMQPLIGVVRGEIERNELGNAYESLNEITDLFGRFGATWSSGEAFRRTTQITEAVLSGFDEGQTDDLERPGLVPAIFDLLALLPMSVEVGFHQSVASVDVEELGEKLRSTNWSNESSPYQERLPRKVIASLEQTHKGAVFEKAAGAAGVEKTPGWYVVESSFTAFEQELKTQIDELTRYLVEWFPGLVEKLKERDMHLASAAVLSRAIEASWKLDQHLEHWRTVVESIRQLGEKVDFNRPNWDWDSYADRVKQLRDKVTIEVAESIPPLAHSPKDDRVPDFFGKAVHLTGESCLVALREDDSDRFRTIFPKFLIGAMIAHERLRQDVTNLLPEVGLPLVLEPIVDVIHVSGYAYIFSEFHDDTALVDVTETAWSTYLGSQSADRLEALAAFMKYQKRRLGFTPRSIHRFSWKAQLSSALADLPNTVGSTANWDEGEVDHASALIRELAAGGDLMTTAFEPDDIFIALFLSTREGTSGLDFGIHERDLQVILDLVDQTGPNEGTE